MAAFWRARRPGIPRAPAPPRVTSRPAPPLAHIRTRRAARRRNGAGRRPPRAADWPAESGAPRGALGVVVLRQDGARRTNESGAGGARLANKSGGAGRETGRCRRSGAERQRSEGSRVRDPAGAVSAGPGRGEQSGAGLGWGGSGALGARFLGRWERAAAWFFSRSPPFQYVRVSFPEISLELNQLCAALRLSSSPCKSFCARRIPGGFSFLRKFLCASHP